MVKWIQTHHPELNCSGLPELRTVSNGAREGLRRSFSLKQYVFNSCPAAAMIDRILELEEFPRGSLIALLRVIDTFNTPPQIPSVNKASATINVHSGAASVLRTERRI